MDREEAGGESRRELSRQFRLNKTARLRSRQPDRFHAETNTNTDEVLALVKGIHTTPRSSKRSGG